MSSENTVIHAPGPEEKLVVAKGVMPELPEYGAIIKVRKSGMYTNKFNRNGIHSQ